MAVNKVDKEIKIENHDIINEMFGRLDKNLDIIEDKLNIKVLLRNNKIKLIGEEEDVVLGEKLISDLSEIIKSQKKLNKHDLLYAIDLVLRGEAGKIKNLLDEVIMKTSSGKILKPKTLGQKRYIDSMNNNDIVFGIGPAGTGKTYLAMAMAIKAFKTRK